MQRNALGSGHSNAGGWPRGQLHKFYPVMGPLFGKHPASAQQSRRSNCHARLTWTGQDHNSGAERNACLLWGSVQIACLLRTGHDT
eukprot:1146944-Pelagomonas_calceolata.AAC.1